MSGVSWKTANGIMHLNGTGLGSEITGLMWVFKYLFPWVRPKDRMDEHLEPSTICQLGPSQVDQAKYSLVKTLEPWLTRQDHAVARLVFTEIVASCF